MLDIENCIVDWARGGSAEIAAIFDGDVTIFNSVFTGADTGVQINGGTAVLKNCALFDNGDDVLDNSGGSATITIDTCASDDGDGANPVDISPGATEADDWNGRVRGLRPTATSPSRIRTASWRMPARRGGPAADILGANYGTADIGAFAFDAAGATPFPTELFKRANPTNLRM